MISHVSFTILLNCWLGERKWTQIIIIISDHVGVGVGHFASNFVIFPSKGNFCFWDCESSEAVIHNKGFAAVCMCVVD
jgi:hypothetical protein